MIISEKKGNLPEGTVTGKELDWLHLEWFEAGKRILHKRTVAGSEIICRFLSETHRLMQGDILFEDETRMIVVSILTCPAIVFHPADHYELASVCYEIGNKHLPLYFENGELLVPYDLPLYRQLSSQGYLIEKEERKLLHPLKTTVSPHADTTTSSLFSKIMRFTTTGSSSKGEA